MNIPNGTYTITSPTGEHRTFQVKTQREDSRFAAGKRIVALLSGPDNEHDYQGFGFVRDDGIQVWRSKQGGIFERYAKLLWSLATRGEDSTYYRKGARLLLEKRCLRCNRKLTTPESIERGIGPECAEMM